MSKNNASTAAVLAAALSLLFFRGAPALAQDFHPVPPDVPDYVVFATDTVRFNRSDYIERMDRELISFTYMHSTSTLMLRRSEKIFRIVTPILRENGIPEDLKYILAIESNFDPEAVSVTGASGLWQFTKATAATYGLEVNPEVDERFNIEKETQAACRFLKDAYKKFGDWITVAASYNMGQGGISRRLEEQQQSSALELYMKDETQRYIFRVLAAKMFFNDPESFGYELGNRGMYRYVEPKEIVTVTGPVPSLVEFAKEHGVSYNALKKANPWLRDNKLTNKAGKAYQIIIPAIEEY